MLLYIQTIKNSKPPHGQCIRWLPVVPPGGPRRCTFPQDQPAGLAGLRDNGVLVDELSPQERLGQAGLQLTLYRTLDRPAGKCGGAWESTLH